MTNNKLYIFFGIFITLFFLALAGFSGGDIGAGRLRIGTAYINDSTSGLLTINKGILANGEIRLSGNISLDATNKIVWQPLTYGDVFNITGNGGEITHSASTHTFYGMNGAGLMFSIDSATATNTNTNFTKLGSGAPAIKQVLLTGVVPAVGGTLNIAHGIADYNKIIGINYVVRDDSLTRTLPAGYNVTTGLSVGFNVYAGSTNVTYITPSGGGGSVNLVGDTIKVVVTYTQ